MGYGRLLNFKNVGGTLTTIKSPYVNIPNAPGTTDNLTYNAAPDGSGLYKVSIAFVEIWPGNYFPINSCRWESPPGTYPCDCINGACLPAATYGTPGTYTTLAACTAGCAKNSPCNGECVDPEEIAQLQTAASGLRAKLCK